MNTGQVVQCTECGAKTSGRFTRCPGCGGALVAVVGTAQRQTGPQVVYGERKRKRSAVSIIVLGVLGVCVLCGVLGGGYLVLGGLGSMDLADAPARNTLAPSIPLPTSTPLPVAPSFAEIEATIEAMTEAQWKAYLGALEGQRVVNWSGWVTDVNVAGSRYELQVDMDSPGEGFSTYDVVFEIPESAALTYQKEQPVRFSGTIQNVSEFLGSVNLKLVDVDVSP